MVLGGLEASFPGITAKFLAGLELFIARLASAAEQALASFGKGLSNLPTENPTGPYCVRIVSVAGVESHKCYTTVADRNSALAQLKAEDVLHLETITAYDIPPKTTLYCVKYTGFLNTPGDQCFSTAAERDQFIALAGNRIANPQPYTKTT